MEPPERKFSSRAFYTERPVSWPNREKERLSVQPLAVRVTSNLRQEIRMSTLGFTTKFHSQERLHVEIG